MTSGRRILRPYGLLLAGALAGCSAARPLRPLPPRAAAVEVSVPGVWIQNGRTYPVGLPVLGSRLGVREDLEVFLRWYAPLAVARIAGLETGATWHPRPAANGWMPALHLAGILSTLVAPGHLHDGFTHAVRGAIGVDATAHWEVTERVWPYVVVQYGLVLADGRSVGSGYGGVQLRLSPRWDLSMEAGVAGFSERTRAYSQPILGAGGRGAVAMSWCVAYRFGGGER